MHGVGNKVIEISAILGIYFADIKPYYKWGYMSDTVVFGYQKEDRIDFCVIFYNVKTGEQKIGCISITLLPSAILSHHIRAIWRLNRPNMPKYAWGW